MATMNYDDIQKDIIDLANDLINPEFYYVSLKRAPDADAFVLGLYDKEHNFFVETLIPTVEIYEAIKKNTPLTYIEHKLLRMKLTLLQYRGF